MDAPVSVIERNVEGANPRNRSRNQPAKVV
jgi:hypothetical protein